MEEPTMPLIEAKGERGSFTPTQKTKITSNFTDAIVSIEEGDMSTIAWDNIEEVFSDEWEIGGLAMTTDAIPALVAGE
jgi:phenylpyruvate tautomerase PptA (4-oxalocrotonate tautomerase family)